MDLFHDGLDAALEDAVFALGGWQKAAHEIWPTCDPTEKARYLRTALDPSRKEKLSGAEKARLIQSAANAGCITPAMYVCAISGCKPPERLDPDVEEAKAVEAVELAAQALAEASKVLEGFRK